MIRRRWSDNDRHFWPFTYAHDICRRFGAVLSSGDEESPGCCLRLHIARHTLIIEMPPILWPRKVKVTAPSCDAATVARLGRDWYFDVTEREFGATFLDDAVHLHFGAQTNDSLTHRSKVLFVPWLNWRHVRHSIYGLHGEHVRTEQKGESWETGYEARKACPTASFDFDDFDGERISVRTHIEEREWRRGTGSFKWLSLFCRPRIHRSLDLAFSKETGERKGSWKGGTISHSIEMLPGELHESAFRRYCAKRNMTFVRTTPPDSALEH